MNTARRRRTSWAIAASILAHLGVLTAVLLQRPTLTIPDEPSGPPQAIIPILILPRTPGPVAGRAGRPTPIQLHRRPQRSLPTETPVAPIVVPAARAAETPAQVQAPAALKAPQQPPAPPDAVRATLRAGLGCTEQRLAAMSREERAGCLERLGRGAQAAPYIAPSLSPEKRALLDQAGAAKSAQRQAMEHGIAAPSPSSKAEPSDYSGEPDIASNAMQPASHPASRRAAKVLGPLPP
jgi:hypothetical protein